MGGIEHQWQADLVGVARISTFNNGFQFLLTCNCNVLSKYAWVVPLKDKTGTILVAAFELPGRTKASAAANGQRHRIHQQTVSEVAT